MFPSIRSVVRLGNPIRAFIPRRCFRTITSIDVPTIIQDDCKIDNNWLHQHFPTALGVSVMNNAGKWEDVDILAGLTSEVKKGTKIWITKDTGARDSDIISTMSIVHTGRAQRALQQYWELHPRKSLDIYYLVEITNTHTGADCRVPMLVDTGATFTTLIPQVQDAVCIEAGRYDSVTTTTGVVDMAAGLAKLTLIGRVLRSSVGGPTIYEELPAELNGLTVVNPVHLEGGKSLLGLQTLHAWGLSVDTVDRVLFIKKN